MIARRKPTGGNTGLASFAVVPLDRNFGITQRAIVNMDLGQFSLKMPALISVHAKAQWMNFVVIASIGTRADVLVVAVKSHRLAAARDDEMMPLAIAKRLRAGGRTGAAGAVKGKRVFVVGADDPAIAHAV